VSKKSIIKYLRQREYYSRFSYFFNLLLTLISTQPPFLSPNFTLEQYPPTSPCAIYLMEYHGRKLVNLAWSQKNGEPHLSTFFFPARDERKKRTKWVNSDTLGHETINQVSEVIFPACSKKKNRDKFWRRIVHKTNSYFF
jgi:hypothetical protein